MEQETKPQRLCSEIQLFDICSKETCSCKVGRYCTNDDILARFEAIREDDDPSERFLEEMEDEDDGEDGFGYDDDPEADDYEGDDDDQEDW